MKRTSKYALLAVIALSLAAGGPAAVFAQDGHEGHHPDGAAALAAQKPEPTHDKDAPAADMKKEGMEGGMMGMMEGCPGMGMMMGGGAGANDATARIASIKSKLAITDAQEGPWSAYAATVAANSEGMKSMHQTMMKVMGAKSPVERLTLHLAAMDKRIATLKEMKDSLTNLYAVLSEEQKKAADHALMGLDCMM